MGITIYPLGRDDWLDAQARAFDGVLPQCHWQAGSPVRLGDRFRLVTREAAAEAGMKIAGWIDFVMVLEPRNKGEIHEI